MNDTADWLLFNFSIGDWSISVGQILGIVITLFFLFLIYRVVLNRLLPWFYAYDGNVTDKEKTTIRSIIISIFCLVLIIGLLIFLRFDYLLYANADFELRITSLIEGLLVLQVARLFDKTLSRVLSTSYQKSHPDEIPNQSIQTKKHAGRTMQYIVYTLALIYVVRNLRFDYQHEIGGLNLSLSKILAGILIILIGRLLVWIFTQVVMDGYYQRKKVNLGSQFAINQLIKYVIFVFAILIALDNMGIEMTVLWGGAAALLVGLGLGLQQTFMDLVSGLILLFERSVEVSDVVEVDSLVGTITKIGLRTSNLKTQNNITIVIPNSKLTVDNVVNWSHFDDNVRFNISVGVAYGSDTKLVKKVLLGVAKENSYVLSTPGPFVRFVNFGDSSLDMELHFWTKSLLVAEDIKSDLRFAINEAFSENNIEIPFPQRVMREVK